MARTEFLYENVAGSIAAQIGSGALQPGRKMPSLRAMSGELGVSISTVTQAYQLLESRGLIETLPQSGHYVRTAPAALCEAPGMTSPDPALACVPVNAMLHEFQRTVSDPGCIPLGCAAPNLGFLPGARLAALHSKAAREQSYRMLDYSYPPGELALRRQIAARSIRWLGALRPQDILITSGGMDALNLILKAVAKPGDTVAIESPTFFGLLQVLEHLGLRALEIPTSPEHGLDVEALDRACRRQRVKAAMLIPTFSNPLGALMPEAARRRLIEISRRRGFIIIEDDIYGELHFSAKRVPPIKAFDEDGSVILCSSFSKSLAPGLRIGWIASERYRERLEELQFNSTVSAPTLPQLVLAQFLESGGYDSHLRRFRRTLAACMDRCALSVLEHFPAGTRLTRPLGGYVLWIELPPSIDSVVLFRQALNAGISIAPGVIFSAQDCYRNFIRLNYAQPWSERIEGAVATLGRLVRTLAK